MPRMFMALTREDRLPIVDILNQTQSFRTIASGRSFSATMTS
jgi:hypothetical protein